jgi:hypothetical protein
MQRVNLGGRQNQRRRKGGNTFRRDEQLEAHSVLVQQEFEAMAATSVSLYQLCVSGCGTEGAGKIRRTKFNTFFHQLSRCTRERVPLDCHLP